MIGTRIGQYRVLQLLGEGAMGRVMLVEHALIKTRHALKILHEQTSNNDVIAQRFINEARAAGTIGHRNVVEVTHVDQVEGGPWYLVMKYLEGQTLTRFLASRHGPLEQRLIVHIIGEALNGLQAAHDRRIIHRDLKPDNLYLTAVKDDPYRTIILDFGVAQLGHDAGVRTGSGAVIGTPQYMSPEQHRGVPLDHRADLWAIAAIVYEMATGWLPYQGDGADRDSLTAQEIFFRMMTRPVVDPRHYNPALTDAFASATLHALQTDPARRAGSARELALMLADGTPGDACGPSGRELLRRYADELLEDGVVAARGSSASIAGAERTPADALDVADPAPGATEVPDVAEVPDTTRMPIPPTQMSTLGTAASQSISIVPARRTRPWFMVGVAVFSGVVACAVARIVVLTLRASPRVTTPPERAIAVVPDATIASIAAHDEAVADVDAGPATTGDAVPSLAASHVEKPGTGEAAATDGRPIDAPAPISRRDGMQVPEPRSSGVLESRTRKAGSPANGELKVVVLPWAEVWLDGKRLGQAPILGLKVPPGRYTLRLKNDAAERTLSVTVTSSRLTVVDMTL